MRKKNKAEREQRQLAAKLPDFETTLLSDSQHRVDTIHKNIENIERDPVQAQKKLGVSTAAIDIMMSKSVDRIKAANPKVRGALSFSRSCSHALTQGRETR